MILGAGLLQLPAIIKAKELGLYVIAVDIDPMAVGFKYSDESLLVSTIDTKKILTSASKKHIDGIMTLATDMPVRAVSEVVKKLSLVGISTETAICTTNKYKMRKRLALNNIPIPAYYKTNNIDEYLIKTKLFNDVFIVKPADNSGSRGVSLVRSEQEIEQAFYYAKKHSGSGEVLIEEFMTGREVSVETLSVDGKVSILAITDKLTTGAPFFVEMGHSQPAQFERSIIEKIKKVAIDAVLALGIENGASHTEIIVTETGPKIVEIGARLGGDNITTHLVPLSTGIDMVGCSIKIALGEKPDVNNKFNRGSAIRYFKTNTGIIQSISGVEKASLIKGIHNVTFVKDVGDIVNNINSSSDRVGFVIASGQNAKEAIATCEQAMDLIKISISNQCEETSFQSNNL